MSYFHVLCIKTQTVTLRTGFMISLTVTSKGLTRGLLYSGYLPNMTWNRDFIYGSLPTRRYVSSQVIKQSRCKYLEVVVQK